MSLLRAPLWPNEVPRLRPPIHKEGWPFICLAGVIELVLWLTAPAWAAWLFLPVALWVVAFFRDPERRLPPGEGLLSPADGRLLPLAMAVPPEELGMGPGKRLRLSIFMNVFNVHVNRIPCNGTVTTLAYRPGKFFNASFDKASVHNERMSIRLKAEGLGAEVRDIAVV